MNHYSYCSFYYYYYNLSNDVYIQAHLYMMYASFMGIKLPFAFVMRTSSSLIMYTAACAASNGGEIRKVNLAACHC